MRDKKYLYCYKMTHDTGFAPNPYYGVLTLATCKPTIRRCAKKDYWISGWTSVTVQGKDGMHREFRDKQKLIYLAKVSEVLKIENYWFQYKKKQPIKMCNGEPVINKSCGGKKEVDIYYNCGDNIYEPSSNDTFGFKQHENFGGHGVKDKEHDLSGKNVLICKEFYYFGVENALEIEVGNGFTVPRCKKLPLESKEAQIIIEKVTANYKSGIYEDNIK